MLQDQIKKLEALIAEQAKLSADEVCAAARAGLTWAQQPSPFNVDYTAPAAQQYPDSPALADIFQQAASMCFSERRSLAERRCEVSERMACIGNGLYFPIRSKKR